VGNSKLLSKYIEIHKIFETFIVGNTFIIDVYLFGVVTFQLENYFQPQKTAKSHENVVKKGAIYMTLHLTEDV
jgi:hypothetical protein